MDKESQNKNIGPETPIILYDGICNLCTESIRFVIQRDSRKQFRFASLQSSFANAYVKKFGKENEDLTSMILIIENQVYRQSTAVLLAAKRLDGLWSFLTIFLLIPRPIRDCVYNWIATYRYRIFGKKAFCWKPTSDLSDRFIET
jgi:predicted DCC family thiol-disulfide oxidoreductase YuxK